jgi:dihydrofolate reductase
MEQKTPVIPRLRVNIIAAVAVNGAIGRSNRLPWHLPEDLQRFKQLTMGHPIIMGRHTWESLGSRPLPGRPNVVVSSSLRDTPGATIATSLRSALDFCRGFASQNGQCSEQTSVHCNEQADYFDVFVIGGAMLYRAALPVADRMLLTIVDQCPTDADAFFPDWDARQWRETKKEKHNGFSFMEYLRK